jgi:DNA-binding protein
MAAITEGQPERVRNASRIPARAGAARSADDNMVFVGKKPTMSYVLAVMTQMQRGLSEIHIRARGRSISRAVDVAEVVRSRFAQDMKRDIEIGTEIVEDRDKRQMNVSTIDIRLTK